MEFVVLEQYLHVSRCWNNYRLSVRHKMTAEKAIRILRDVADNTKNALLRRRAMKLLREIIVTQDEPDYLKDVAQ